MYIRKDKLMTFIFFLFKKKYWNVLFLFLYIFEMIERDVLIQLTPLLSNSLLEWKNKREIIVTILILWNDPDKVGLDGQTTARQLNRFTNTLQLYTLLIVISHLILNEKVVHAFKLYFMHKKLNYSI